MQKREEKEQGKSHEIQDEEVQDEKEIGLEEDKDLEEDKSEEAAEKEEESTEEKLKREVGEAKEKYLRLYSEFENFRRRTAKEKIELIGSANKNLVGDLVPVMDDFERALKSFEDKEEMKAAKEGTELIYNKFRRILENKGLKKMEVGKGTDFDDNFHEAVTQVPMGEEMAGKVVDVLENGYFLNEKVVRFAKVVTGAKT